MRRILTAMIMVVTAQTSVRSWAYPVYTPPGNIVQNGCFQSYSANWSGNIPAFLGNWSSIPNDYAALANDIYQVLSTSPGQQYSLSFYTAADLYLAPSVSVAVALNGSTLASFDTPPYAWDPQFVRYDQMHWEELTYSFTASSTATKLEFIDLNTHDFGLAAVSVVPVPDNGGLTLSLVGAMAIEVVRRRCGRSSRTNGLSR